MRLVRIALANVNTTVGAFSDNVDRALVPARQAAAEGATLVAMPEQLVSGYSPEDLVQWQSFVERQWVELERFARETRGLDPFFVLGVTVGREALLYNCAAVVRRGRILGLVPKEKLPTYNVFYEGRTFARGGAGLAGEVRGVPFGDLIFDADFGVFAVEVCEDMWSPDGPMRRRCLCGAELVVNLSASPYRVGMPATRREMISTRSSDNQCALAYVNLIGGNDGLIFDGGSYVAQNGRLVHEGPHFVEGMTAVTIDLDRTRRLRMENTTYRDDLEAERARTDGSALPRRVLDEAVTARAELRYPVPSNRSFFLPIESPAGTARAQFCEELLDALALGLGDYFEKVGAFRTIGIALSGGRDSLLCLLLARRYVDRRFSMLDEAARAERAGELLRAFYMPTRYSSSETRAAAERAAADVGARFVLESIDEAFERELASVEKMLAPGEEVTRLARQNIQARIRAARMWTWANASAGLFLQTSNMSEKAVGYSTIGGDSEGALAVVANLPKTVVNYLLDYLFETTRAEGIRLTLLKPATAELAENQEDEKDLMPFPVLDACFALFAGEKVSPDELERIIAEMFPELGGELARAHTSRFVRMFTQSIYKWVQAPLSLHVGNLDLERERALQLPVVQRNQW